MVNNMMTIIKAVDTIVPFRIIATNGTIGATLTNATYKYRVNGEVGAHAFASPTIGVYLAATKSFTITIPAAQAANVGDIVEVIIAADEGEAYFVLQVVEVDHTAALATITTNIGTNATAIAAVKTVVDADASTIAGIVGTTAASVADAVFGYTAADLDALDPGTYGKTIYRWFKTNLWFKML